MLGASYINQFSNSTYINQMGKKMNWEIIGDVLLRLTALGGLGVAGILAILIWKKNLATKVTYMRFVIQAVSFAALFYIFSYSLFHCFTFDIHFCYHNCFWSILLRLVLSIWLIMDFEVYGKKSLQNSLSNSP